MFVDNAKGRLIAAEVTQNLNLESSPPGQSEKTVWKVSCSISTKLIPAKSGGSRYTSFAAQFLFLRVSTNVVDALLSCFTSYSCSFACP